MGLSSTSQLLALSRAAFFPMSLKGTITRGLLLIASWATFLHFAYHIDPDDMLVPGATKELDLGELFLGAVLMSAATALVFLKWNFLLLSCLYILAISDAVLLYLLKKLSGSKSDVPPPRWVTRWVTPSAAWFRGVLVNVYPGLAEMMEEIRRDVEGQM